MMNTTQLVSIILSLVLLIRTTTLLGLMTEDDSKHYLLTRTPHYAASIISRLGCISLSFIFFGFWTVCPLLFLLCVLGSIGFIHRHDLDIFVYMLVPSNLFVLSI